MHVALNLLVGDGPAGHPGMISSQGDHSDTARSLDRLQPPSGLGGIGGAVAWVGLRSGLSPSHQPTQALTPAMVVVAGPAILTDAPQPVFLPVEIHGGELPAARIASPRHGAHGRVEIVLATAHRLVVEGPFDADALGRLLSVLARP